MIQIVNLILVEEEDNNASDNVNERLARMKAKHEYPDADGMYELNRKNDHTSNDDFIAQVSDQQSAQDQDTQCKDSGRAFKLHCLMSRP